MQEFLIGFGIWFFGVVVSAIMFITINNKVKDEWYHTDCNVFFQHIGMSWLMILIFIETLLVVRFGGCRKGAKAHYRWYYN